MDLDKLGKSIVVEGITYFEKCPFCGQVFTFKLSGKTVLDCSSCGFFGFIEDLEEAIRNARQGQFVIPTHDTPDGLIDVGEYMEPNVSVTRIPTGFQFLDEALNGFTSGLLTVITGATGQGKSTLASQIALNVVDSGFKVCFYSGELPTRMFQKWAFLQAAGQNNLRQTTNDIGVIEFEPTVSAESRIRPWLQGKLYLSDNKKVHSNEQRTIFQRFQKAKHVKGCSLFVIDNLMACRMDSQNERDFNRQQSAFTAECAQFALENNVHVVLVAHPKKGDVTNPNEAVAGTADIVNLAANVLRIDRASDKEKMEMGGINSVITISKNRENGILGRRGFYFDSASKRFVADKGITKEHYVWEM